MERSQNVWLVLDAGRSFGRKSGTGRRSAIFETGLCRQRRAFSCQLLCIAVTEWAYWHTARVQQNLYRAVARITCERLSNLLPKFAQKPLNPIMGEPYEHC